MKTAMLIVTVLCFGCSDGMSLMRPDAGSVPDAVAAPDVLEALATDADESNYDAKLGCPVYPIAWTSGCSDAQVALPVGAPTSQPVTVYWDSDVLGADEWHKTDDGAAIVITRCDSVHRLISVSFGCVAVVDCTWEYGCR